MQLLRPICAMLVLTAGIPAMGMAEEKEAPLVDAGLDQSVTKDSVVYLDGGGAVDPDGEIVHYSWTIETPRGAAVRPSDPDAERTRFVADETGRYRVTLTVRDDDGLTRSDTLFVDVSNGSGAPGSNPGDDSGGSPDESPNTGPSDSTGDSASPGDPPSDVADGPVDPIERTSNQAPYARIFGPDSVRAGSTGSYTLKATDEDGHVVDYWWVPPGELSMQGRVIESYAQGNAYTFDVEPGTTVELPAVVVDNDGARSRVTKTVEVTNNPPDVTMVGSETVVVGSLERYEAIASDADGPVVSYSWSAGSGVEAVETGGLLDGSGSGESGESRLFRFTEIPQDDATVAVQVTVSDEQRKTVTAEKEITIIGKKESKVDQPINIAAPEVREIGGRTIPGNEQVFRDTGIANPNQIAFSATAIDNDSDRLIYDWQFGNEGSATTVETGEDKSSEVTFMFEPAKQVPKTIPISVTVTDDNGHTDSITRELTLTPGGAYRNGDGSINVDSTDEGIITGRVVLPTDIVSYDTSKVTLHFGDGSTMGFPLENGKEDGQFIFDFQHRYRYGGEYTLFLFDGNQHGGSLGYTDVAVEKRTYTEWYYEQRIESELETTAENRPGEEWMRSGVDHVELELVDTRTTTTPLMNGEVVMRPGESWTNVGTTTEYRTETRTRRATSSPGPEWTVSKRNVGEKRVVDERISVTVPWKGLADSNWEYVGPVAKTVTRTERRESADRPNGSGWTRTRETGERALTGYSRQWVSSRYLADRDWEYVRSDRYVAYYRTESECIQYADMWGYRYCVEEVTNRDPVYRYRYLYDVPEYDPIYEWERSVESTVYDYEYEYPTYTSEAVHQYTKEVRVSEQRAEWEKKVFEENTVYTWTKSEYRWVEETSFSQPSGQDVRNVTNETKQCGEEWNSGEPAICVAEDQE